MTRKFIEALLMKISGIVPVMKGFMIYYPADRNNIQ